jgi:RimJ/RimL family protein N-acetyltransferase
MQDCSSPVNMPGILVNFELRIRPAVASDRKQLITLIDQVAGERQHLQTDRYHPTPEWENLLRGESCWQSRVCLFVAESCGQMIGFIRLNPETRPWHIDPAGNIGIALLAPYRHQHIGTHMLYLIIDQATKFQYRCLTADILAHNQASLGLFKKFGFINHSLRKLNLDFIRGEVQEITVERVTGVGGSAWELPHPN